MSYAIRWGQRTLQLPGSGFLSNQDTTQFCLVLTGCCEKMRVTEPQHPRVRAGQVCPQGGRNGR